MNGLRYQEKDTAVHRLNPVTKLVWACGLVVLSLIFDHPLHILVLLIAIALIIGLAGVWQQWRSVLKWSLWLGASVIVINALVSYHGAHILLTAPFQLPVLGIPVITLEAIAFGSAMALKLLVIISAFAFINLTLHPDDIMTVLLKMKLPYKSVLVTSLSARFIPCLIEDAERISDSYMTRGVQMDTGNWFGKLRSRAGIIIPLLANSLDRAVQVAEAMEARAFGSGQKRVFYKNIRMSRMDWLTLAFGILPLASGIILRALGYGSYEYYPNLQPILLNPIESILLCILIVVLLAILPLAFLKRRVELD